MAKINEKPRIVAVDDDRDFLEALRLMLSPHYEVECFSNGGGLLDQMESLAPDLVILDVHMPGLNGFRLCEEIRGDARFEGLPILFLTASNEDGDFLRTLDAGGNYYVNKPIGSRELHHRIRDALNS